MIRKIATVSLLVTLAITCLSSADGGKGRHRRHHRRRVAETIERANTEQDLRRDYVGYVRQQDDGSYVMKVAAVWGDLDKQIEKCSSEFYSNWDGTFTVTGGTVELKRQLRFDARDGREPAEGSGVDKLLEGSDTQVAWLSGVVGGIDGLLFSLSLEDLNSSATLVIGGQTVTITPTVYTAPAEEEDGVSEGASVNRL